MAVAINISEDNAAEVYCYLRDAIAWYGAAFFKMSDDEPASATESRSAAALHDWQRIDPVCMRISGAPLVHCLQDWIDTYLPAKRISRLKVAIKMNRDYARKKEARLAVKFNSP